MGLRGGTHLLPERPEPEPPTEWTDWTADGIYRNAYLVLFDPEEREVLRAGRSRSRRPGHLGQVGIRRLARS